MRKIILWCSACLFVFFAAVGAKLFLTKEKEESQPVAPIAGFWKTIDSKTQKPQSIIAVYEYQGKYYGRLIGSFDDDGQMRDNIYTPQGRAPGVIGNPYYCGMDIIWGLTDEGNGTFKGKIIDPRKGNIYRAEVWKEEGNLIVRGEVFIFGKNITWPAATSADFPKGFKKPNVRKFVPVIPQVD